MSRSCCVSVTFQRYSCVAALAAMTACGGSDHNRMGRTDSGPGATDPSEAFYALAHRVEVAVEFAPENWTALRNQGRGFDALLNPSLSFEYSWFDATVTVDGVRHEGAAVRKKGFLGSLSALRPSLKVQFDRSVQGISQAGMTELTLNNDRQDPSHTHQCMSYRLFASAGLPACRCNLAHVVVNGEDLGTYSNIEPVDEALLRRHFADPTGNLYEGQAADFVTSSVDRIQLKTNKKTNDRSDLQTVMTALASSDEDLPGVLDTVIDLERFRSFWAMEVLTGDWDSYSGNSNNYQVYHDPMTDRFFFLPWGTDAAFERSNPFDTHNDAITVYAQGRIAQRLYALPRERELYRQRLGELNEALWDEEPLLAQVDQIAQLATDADPMKLEAQRQVIRSQKSEMRVALAEPAPEWIARDTQAQSACSGELSDIQGTFETSWGDLSAIAPGVGQLSPNISLDGTPLNSSWFGTAGVDPKSSLGTGPAIRFASILSDGRILVIQFQMPSSLFVAGTVAFQGLETAGVLVVLDGGEMRVLGYVNDGTITLEQAGMRSRAPVVGSFDGRLLQTDCLNN